MEMRKLMIFLIAIIFLINFIYAQETFNLEVEIQ
jgi:hypothetical protein